MQTHREIPSSSLAELKHSGGKLELKDDEVTGNSKTEFQREAEKENVFQRERNYTEKDL